MISKFVQKAHWWIFFTVTTYILPLVTYAQGCDPQSDEGCYVFIQELGGRESVQVGSGGIAGYINFIVELVIGATTVLAVLFLVWAGIQYMTTESFTKKGEAKKTAQRALGGLLLALSSFLILNTINPDLVQLRGIQSLSVEVEETDDEFGFWYFTDCEGNTVRGFSSFMKCISAASGYRDNNPEVTRCPAWHGSDGGILYGDYTPNAVCSYTGDIENIPGLQDCTSGSYYFFGHYDDTLQGFCFDSEQECNFKVTQQRYHFGIIRECTRVDGEESDTEESLITQMNQILRDDVLGEEYLIEHAVRVSLEEMGITTNRGGESDATEGSFCISVTQENCTNVGGLSSTTIRDIGEFKQDCDCDVLISGGTEWWQHGARAFEQRDIFNNPTRHKPVGYEGGGFTVDIWPNEKMDEYIKDNADEEGEGLTCNRYPSSYVGYSLRNDLFEGCFYEKIGGGNWHVEFLSNQ